MATKNSSTSDDDDITARLLAKLNSSSIPSLIKEAIGEGKRLGLKDAVRRIGEGTLEMEAANYTAEPREKKPRTHVQCPVANCTKPGIRPQHNFCKHHSESLDAKKRQLLRAKQVEEMRKTKEKAREAEALARRAEAAPMEETVAA